MKLPVLLLLLAAVGTFASSETSEASPAAGPTSKRELDGNFGQKIDLLDKKETNKSTPAVQYADDQKPTPPEQSVAQQFFGGRVLPITKISDLLTGQGLPFDVALANQLYAPVSVYNTRPPTLAEIPGTEAARNIFNSEEVEDRQKKTLSRTPGFHLPGLLGPEFYSQENRYIPKLSKYVTQTPDPRHFLYQELSNIDPYIPIQYYDHQRITQQEPNAGLEYDSQDTSRDGKSSPLRTEPSSRTDKNVGPSDGRKAYLAHPHGAVSYSSFLHNQPPFEAQSNSQNIHEQPNQLQQEIRDAEFRRYEDLHVPRPPPSNPQPQEKSGPQETAQQFGPISHQLFSPRAHQPATLVQGRPLFETGFQFRPEQQPRYQEFYRKPFPKFYPPSQKFLKTQQPRFQQLPNFGAKFEPSRQVTKYSKPNDESTNRKEKALPELKSSELLVQQNTEGILEGQQQPNLIHGTVLHQQSVIPLNTSIATAEPQITITSKSQPTIKDQGFQPSTIQPDIISDTTKATKYLSEKSIQQQAPQPTLQSLLGSPATLQSLYTPEYYLFSTPQPQLLNPQNQQTTPYHKVQIQQQELDEIHSELLPGGQAETEYITKKIAKEPQSVESKQYQSTTPQPESSSPDYEIEIESNVDHNQLPKDLQPVPGTQDSNDLVEKQQTEEQKTYPHILQNQTNVKQFRHPLAAIHAFGEPPSYQNINFHDPNSFFLDPSVSLGQPQFYSQYAPFVLRPRAHYPHGAFPPVQYFGNHAESIFGGF